MPYNTESSAPCSVMTQRAGMGGWLKSKVIHVYMQLIHFVVQQKPTKHCKAIKLQSKKLSRSYIGHFCAYNFLEDHIPNLSRCRIHLVLCICLPFVTEHSICLNDSLARLLLMFVPFPGIHLFTTSAFWSCYHDNMCVEITRKLESVTFWYRFLLLLEAWYSLLNVLLTFD